MPQSYDARWLLLAGVFAAALIFGSICARIFYTKVNLALIGSPRKPVASATPPPVSTFSITKSKTIPGLEMVKIPESHGQITDGWIFPAGIQNKIQQIDDSQIYLTYFIAASEAAPQKYAEAIIDLDYLSEESQLKLETTGEVAAILSGPDNYRYLDNWVSDSGSLLIYFRLGRGSRAYSVYAPTYHIKAKHPVMQFLARSLRNYDRPDSIFQNIHNISYE